MSRLLIEPALLTVVLTAIAGYVGWQFGRRLVPLMAAATSASALVTAWLIHLSSEGARLRFLYADAASLGEALMTFVPIPLALAATAIVASAGLRGRDRSGDGLAGRDLGRV